MEKYKGEWNWVAFIEFFLYHEVQNFIGFQIYFILLGPFMVIPFSIKPGIILMRNMKFLGHS